MKYLGIDYGLKRIGLAYSEGSLAEPLERLIVNSPASALEKVLKTILDLGISVVVIGQPDPDSIGARFFGEKLAQTTNLKIIFVDETMTSVDALEKLKQLSLKKRKNILDSAAATLILNAYLEENPQTLL